MRTDQVPVRVYLFNNILISWDIESYTKEGSRHLATLQNIQYSISVSRVWPIIKGNGYQGFGRIA
jgi:hypothetical protein